MSTGLSWKKFLGNRNEIKCIRKYLTIGTEEATCQLQSTAHVCEKLGFIITSLWFKSNVYVLLKFYERLNWYIENFQTRNKDIIR